MRSSLPTSAIVAFTVAGAIAACAKREEPPPQPAAEPRKPEQPGAGAPPAAAPPAVGEPGVARGAALREPPKSLGRIQVPADNPLTPAKVELGHELFFDKRLSADGSLACYSCHLNEDGTGGHDPTAIGPKGVKLPRHAPTMWNVAYLPRLYWDGRAKSLEEQGLAALEGGNMGLGEEGLSAKAREIEATPAYKAKFEAIFPADGVTPETIVKALASYERTLFCGDTAWDRFSEGNAAAMTDEQKKGWGLFTGKAACNNCHTPPFFSDAYTNPEGAFHNVGIGMEGKKEAEIDVGRQKVTENPSDWAVFKTPSLRNVTRSAPYFMDGSIAKLEDAVRFMVRGGYKNKNLDPKLSDKKLTDSEVKSLIAFLGALECPGKLEEPKLP